MRKKTTTMTKRAPTGNKGSTSSDANTTNPKLPKMSVSYSEASFKPRSIQAGPPPASSTTTIKMGPRKKKY